MRSVCTIWNQTHFQTWRVDYIINLNMYEDVL